MTQPKRGIDRYITRIAGWVVGVFKKVESRGGPIPAGPVLVVANHPNSLLDPLIVFRVAGRPTRPLAKAPLFEQVILGAVLRALGGLPVFRRQDDASLMHRNEKTFDAAIAALVAGDAIQIYPEGRSHSEPGLGTVKTGAARIALGAEASSSWSLGLLIVPIGLTYRSKSLFRGSAIAVIGDPFSIADLQGLWQTDEAGAVRTLTDRIARSIETVTLNLSSHEDLELIEAADRLYASERGTQHWREREGMAERMPRLQAFVRGLAWLRANDPQRHDRLERAVRRYRKVLSLHGAAEVDVPHAREAGSLVRYVLGETAALAITLPFAAIGAILWAPAWFAPRLVLAAVKPDFEAIATWKLTTAFFTVPLTLATLSFVVWRFAGPVAAALAIPAAFLTGFAAIDLYERWHRVREDVRVFVRALTHPRGPDRLAQLRAALASEFDAILDLLPPEGAASDDVPAPAPRPVV
jgi:glycerol-3-phosphate O-acyltransferase / dihydroxyacetone phosphate acyltransferase